MLMFETLVDFASRKSILSMVYSALAIFLLTPLIGCADESAGGPINSSLSASTDAASELDSDPAPSSAAEEAGGEKDPTITMTSTPSGVTANVSWDHPPDFDVAGYTLYYGKRSQDSIEATSEEFNPEESSSEEPSSCSQGESKAVEAPSATITGLQPNTAYFFAIRAFTKNESESLCSNEIVVITPAAEA